MSDDLVRITVSGGKYTFVQKTDGSCYALRYGEPWREDIFDGMTLAMAHRIEELEAKLAQAVELVERAFNEGFGEGMNDLLRQSGGKTWYDSRSRKRLAELTGGKDE